MALGTTAAPANPPRNRWEKVLGSTPVFLTVVATVLAGQSTGEMTRAQYFRALASQYQSKAGDQWAFFQAKRDRGTTRETMADALRALTLSGKVDLAELQAVVDQLPQEFARAQTEARHLTEAVARAKDNLGANEDRVRTAAERLLQAAEKGAADARSVQTQAAREFARPDVRATLTYLNGDQLPRAETARYEDPQIDQVVAAIRDRKPEAESALLVLDVKPRALQEAIATAERNAQAFGDAAKPIDKSAAAIDALVQRESAAAQALFQAARHARWAVADAAGDAKPLADLRTQADQAERHAQSLKGMVDEVSHSLLTARMDYSARRQEREARDNQAAAYLYEVRVLQNSAESDRHLRRSKNFFYGMLTAQLAVTISTLALAVRYKSVLWTLAACAGLAAVAYGISVYLDLFPFLGGQGMQ